MIVTMQFGRFALLVYIMFVCLLQKKVSVRLKDHGNANAQRSTES
jgi:hypothetical protein